MTVKLKGQWARPVDCTCDAKSCPHQRSGSSCKGDATLEVESDSSVDLSRGEHWLCQRCFKHAEIRDIHSRDPEKSMRSAPGMKNPARRAKIGRRKTVRMSASGLITRRNRRKAKSAMFRMGQKSKLLACHACSRNDFATEKSLKRHTEKFHTPGQKSPRGFRTARDSARDPQEWYILLFDNRGAFSTFVTSTGDKSKALKKAAAYRRKGYAKVEVTKHHPSASRSTKGRWDRRVAKHNRASKKWGMGGYRRDAE